MTLTWNPVPDPDLDGYVVLFGLPEDEYWSVATWTPIKATTFKVAGLESLALYDFAVLAVDAAEQESPLSLVSATTLSAAPTGLVATRSYTQVTLTWDAVPDAASYQVYYAKADDEFWTPVEGTPAHWRTSTISGLNHDTEYDFGVSTVMHGPYPTVAESDLAVVSVTIPPLAPPSDLRAMGRNGYALLEWSGQDASAWNVYRAPEPDGPWTKLTVDLAVQSTQYFDNNLTNGTTYWYRVTGIDELGRETAPGVPDSAVPHEPPVVSSGDLPQATQGQSYQTTLASTGGFAPITWELLTAAPTGLALSEEGVLSGNPQESGTFTLHVLATDVDGGVGVGILTLTVHPPP